MKFKKKDKKKNKQYDRTEMPEILKSGLMQAFLNKDVESIKYLNLVWQSQFIKVNIIDWEEEEL